MGGFDRKRFYAPRKGVIATIVYLITYSCVLLFAKLISRLKVRGRENIRLLHGGGFVVSNHVLYLDPALLCVAFYPRRLYFSAMEESFKIPVIGAYIRMLGAFPVSGHMSGSTLIRNTLDMILEGRLIHFFPEGNLVHLANRLQEFKQGVFELSVLTGKPIFPVTITTVRRGLFGETLNRYLCRVVITIGKPLFPGDFDGAGSKKREIVKRMMSRAWAVIHEELDETARTLK